MTNYKQFDLKAAKRGAPVVTRDGRKARIVCFDYDSEFALLGLIEESVGRDLVCMFSEDGRCYSEHRNRDLFMAAPAIPEGFTPYDPNVPPPENAEEIEVIYKFGGNINREREFFAHDWSIYNQQGGWRNQRIAYRVTKWQEAKPSLEDVVYTILAKLNKYDARIDEIEMKDALNQFADAIVQRAVDKIKGDQCQT